MRNLHKIVIIGCAVASFSTCTSKRQVSKEELSYEKEKSIRKVDTVFKDRIIEKEVIVRDTVFRGSTKLDIKGKPTWDSINKIWKPFTFDYTIYVGNDSTRYKGSFSGEGSANYGTDWETLYKSLLEKQKDQSSEASKSETEETELEKVIQNKKEVLKEGYTFELVIYILSATALVFYLFGLFTPRLKNLVINFIKKQFPITWFTKQK